MAFITRYQFGVTSTASGGASQVWTTPPFTGFVEAIRYVAGPSQWTTAAHLDITGAKSGINIINTSVTATGPFDWYPRARQGNTGSGFYSWATGAGALVGVPTRVPLSNEGIRIHATGLSASAGLNAVFHIYVEGNGPATTT